MNLTRRNCLTLALLVVALAVPRFAYAAADFVIQISVDGLRSDTLNTLMTSQPSRAPNFLRLRTQGASTLNARSDLTVTETVPNHIAMITGRPVDQPAGLPNTTHHGFSNNFPTATDTIHANGNPNVPYKSSTFDVVHDNGMSTGLFTSKTRLGILDRSYNVTNGALDTVGADNGRDKIDFSMLVDNTSANIVNTFVANMTATPYRYSFIHLTEPDGAGHGSGFTSAAYSTAIETVDSRLGQIFNLIDNNPTLAGHTAIVLVADHGGGDPINNHTVPTTPINYTIPFFVWGGGVPAGSDMYALATNRFNPGTTRQTYVSPQQPFWSGDSGNIALSLLGLDPIPNSFLRPNLQIVPEPATSLLAVFGVAIVVCRRQRNRLN